MLLVMMWKGEEMEKEREEEKIEGAHETTHGRTRLPTTSIPLKDCINSLSKVAAGKCNNTSIDRLQRL